jgi:hypothetical protein
MIREQNGTIGLSSCATLDIMAGLAPAIPILCAFPTGITGTRPVMTAERNVQGGYECNHHRRVIVR